MSLHERFSIQALGQIQTDRSRFRQKLDDVRRKNLGRYLTVPELVGKRGKDLVTIPIPVIDIPQFRFKFSDAGVGAGEGNQGAGTDPGEHFLEDITIDEITQLLAREVELPNLLPLGNRNIDSQFLTLRGSQREPTAKFNFRRAYFEALKAFPPNEAIYHIQQRDFRRYRSPDTRIMPDTQAAIIYMMDVSGSMSDEYKERVRMLSYWMDRLIQQSYPHVERKYITHCADARVVNEQTFYHTRESGGTVISSAYRLCREVIDREYPTTEWNVFPFHFTDGENDTNDNAKSAKILAEGILPRSRLFGLGIISNPGTTYEKQFVDAMTASAATIAPLEGCRRYVVTRNEKREDILPNIVDFVGKRKQAA